jgi:hypothetical protein
MTTRLQSFSDSQFPEHRRDVLRGLFHVERFRAHFDRSVQKQAGTNASTANTTGAGFGSTASQIGSTLIPGLEREATNPTGFTPLQKNRMLVAGAEATGGANAAAGGQAALEKLRTRNPSGFSAALDEAARIKNRAGSANALSVENADAQLAQQKQAQAQRALQGIYGTDTENQLRAMGLANEDLNTQLNAGKTGWLQNAEGVIGTIADASKAYKPGGWA